MRLWLILRTFGRAGLFTGLLAFVAMGAAPAHAMEFVSYETTTDIVSYSEHFHGGQTHVHNKGVDLSGVAAPDRQADTSSQSQSKADPCKDGCCSVGCHSMIAASIDYVARAWSGQSRVPVAAPSLRVGSLSHGIERPPRS